MTISSTASRRLIVESLLILVVAATGLAGVFSWLAPDVTGLRRGVLYLVLLVLVAGPALYVNARMVNYRGLTAPYTSDTANARLAVFVTVTTQILILLITGAVVHMQRLQIKAQAFNRFEQGAERIETEIRRRFALSLEGLKGARGMYAAGLRVNRAQFRAYMASRDLQADFLGGRGLGFVQRISRSEVAAFTARQQAEGATDFAVKSSGQAPDLYVIRYIEPLVSNRAALGLDLGQEQVRREGAERAVATGLPALTGAITLVQDGSQGPGLLYFLPVFRPGFSTDSPAQRQSALLGLLYAPLVLSEMLDSAVAVSVEPIEFALFAGGINPARQALFDSSRRGEVMTGAMNAPTMFEGMRLLDIGGQKFSLQTKSTPVFEAGIDWSSVMAVGVAGIFVSFWAAVTVWLLMAGRLRALLQAQRMTADLDRLAKVVRHTSNSVFIADTEQRINWVNEGFTRISGYTLDDARGRTPGELLGNGKADSATIRMLLRAAANGEPCRVEVLNRSKDGRDYWVDTEVQPMRNLDGKLTGFMEISSDVTERKRAEAEVRRAENLLRESIEALDEAFVLFDPEDRLVLCNQRYKDLHVLSADAIAPGSTYESIIRTGAERGQYKEAIGRVDSWVTERLLAHRQNSSQAMQDLDDGRILRSVERRMPDGHTVGFLIDITDLVNATSAAEAALMSKTQFLANMSHEIRTPMNAILGLIKVVQGTQLTPDQKDYLAKIEGAGRSLLGLINDILDFSKVEAGKMTLDPRPFSLDGLLSNLSVILATNLDSKNIEVLFDLDPTMPDLLFGDDMRLSQVLINLCGNAIKFTAEGAVVLRIRALKGMADDVLLEFSVQDSGIGIAERNRERIFSGFSQAEASTTRQFGGTGLGLAISSRLVALMGGQLQLDSMEGIGSNFHFQIQCGLPEGVEGKAPEKGRIDTKALAAWPKRDGLRVLFVDDSPRSRDALAQLAAMLHWQAECASNGQEAVAMVQQATAAGRVYQAIFIDWQMPGMDGWRTFNFIRKMPHLSADTPLVLMGSSAERALLVQRVAEQGLAMPAFVVRPLTASMLDGVIDSAKQAAETMYTQPAHAAAVHDLPTPQPANAEEKSSRLEGMRLLVVEDNPINQMVAERLLSQEGAKVTLAPDGRAGVRAVADAQTPFDAVLMDLQMPVMDGFAATRAIRVDLGRSDLPIIAMTANAMAADRQACLEAGMNDHVGKPFDLDQLVMLLRQHGRYA